MRDLLKATSSAKHDVIPSLTFSTHQCQNFIREEDFRSQPFLHAADDVCIPENVKGAVSFNNAEKPTSSLELSSLESTQRTLEVETQLSLSYVSYDNHNLYRSPSPSPSLPTYLPGDYHDISLHESPSGVVQTDQQSPSNQHVSTERALKLPFSIDALLGDVIDDAALTSLSSAPAHIVSTNDTTWNMRVSAPEERHSNTPNVHNTTSGYISSTPSQNVSNVISVQRQPFFHSDMFSQVMSSCKNAVPNAVFWCHVCARFCSSEDSAERHRYVHTREGVKCNLHSSLFRLHGCVTTHENTGFLGRIKCGLCSKIVCGQYFVKHVRVHNSHTCEICFKECSTKSQLRDHLNEHSGKMPYACAECHRKFGSRVGLTQHMRAHRNFRRFRCSYCEKGFSSKYACAVHERIHSGNNPYKCDTVTCGMSFPQKVQLNLHKMNTHM